jgi:hypothetical protein
VTFRIQPIKNTNKFFILQLRKVFLTVFIELFICNVLMSLFLPLRYFVILSSVFISNILILNPNCFLQKHLIQLIDSRNNKGPA